MLLAIDMGNTHIEVGMLKGKDILFSDRLATEVSKTSSEYAVLLHAILEIRKVNTADIEGAIISSVVPPLTMEIRDAVKSVTGVTPLIVGPSLKSGIRIRIEDPKSLGADLLVGAVAAHEIYGSPAIIIDMGTATTITVVDREGSFIGGAILPGVGISLNALSAGTSKLPKIDLNTPKNVINTSTVDCMQSGIVYGQASLLDGMIAKMKKELGYEAKVIATGGLARLIVPHCESEIILDNDLMLEGLRIIYDKNKA
ncbi:MAG: type III pantothenate kinase [Erysipelotrichaceae bacterium]|nr:type III pantothenate kinase [Erysipelotrichaceae bacterium]